MEVEIDSEDFRGVNVTPKTKIRVIGEIDRDWKSTTVDADRIELVQ